MKKMLKLVLALGCLLSFAGCQEVDELSNKDDFVVINIFTTEREPLSKNDALTITDILENGSWNTEGTSECASNIKITIKEVTFKYHSDCGTFNDNVNQRSLSLDDAAKEKVNAMLAEYISLTSDEVPEE